MVVVNVNRSRGDFSHRDRVLMELLRPHLVQAYRTAEAMTELRGVYLARLRRRRARRPRPRHPERQWPHPVRHPARPSSGSDCTSRGAGATRIGYRARCATGWRARRQPCEEATTRRAHEGRSSCGTGSEARGAPRLRRGSEPPSPRRAAPAALTTRPGCPWTYAARGGPGVGRRGEDQPGDCGNPRAESPDHRQPPRTYIRRLGVETRTAAAHIALTAP